MALRSEFLNLNVPETLEKLGEQARSYPTSDEKAQELLDAIDAFFRVWISDRRAANINGLDATDAEAVFRCLLNNCQDEGFDNQLLRVLQLWWARLRRLRLQPLRLRLRTRQWRLHLLRRLRRRQTTETTAMVATLPRMPCHAAATATTSTKATACA